MTEEEKNTEETTDANTPDEEKNTEQSIPYSRFQEVIEEKNEYKKKWEESQERGDDGDPLAEVNEKVGKYAEARIKDLPEHFQSLLNKLPPLERLDWLAENEDNLTTQIQGIPKTPEGKEGNLTEEDKRQKSYRAF